MFLNLEFVNNFSSRYGWGYFNLQEAYMTYSGDMINVKAGMFLPLFNNMNEISNRTPLLTYIIRPYAYEAAYSELISPDAVIPARALVQVYGNIGDNLERSFYFALLRYNITDEFYLYGMYNVYKDNSSDFLNDEGVVGIGGGLGYNLIDEIILKAQYQNTTVGAQWAGYNLEMKIHQFLAGISVMF